MHENENLPTKISQKKLKHCIALQKVEYGFSTIVIQGLFFFALFSFLFFLLIQLKRMLKLVGMLRSPENRGFSCQREVFGAELREVECVKYVSSPLELTVFAGNKELSINHQHSYSDISADNPNVQ